MKTTAFCQAVAVESNKFSINKLVVENDDNWGVEWAVQMAADADAGKRKNVGLQSLCLRI